MRPPSGLAVQLGGAVGALEVLGAKGPAVRHRVALALGLADVPEWHSHRNNWIDLLDRIALVVVTAGKIARDVSLLGQAEVGEMRDAPPQEGVGGSSAMPHKRNPVGCLHALAAAARMPGLIATVHLAAAELEHERALGGWQAELVAVPEIAGALGSALDFLDTIAGSLVIDADAHARQPRRLRPGAALARAPSTSCSPASHPTSPDRERNRHDEPQIVRTGTRDAPQGAGRRMGRPRHRHRHALQPRLPGDDHAPRVGRHLEPQGPPHPVRRMLVLAMTVAQGRWEEYRLHLRAALESGDLSTDDVKEVLMQAAIYVGVPGANTGFKEAREVIAEVAARKKAKRGPKKAAKKAAGATKKTARKAKK